MPATTKFVVSKDRAGQFRWALLAKNGESVAVSGEGLATMRSVRNVYAKLASWAQTAVLVDETDIAPAPLSTKTVKAPTAKKTVKKAVKKTSKK